MAKVIQFKDGSYGVELGFFFKSYLDKDLQHTWTTGKYVDRYCKFNSPTDAEEAYHKYSISKTKTIKRL